MFTLAQIEDAAHRVHRFVKPTALIRWPLLEARSGCELWVKHENQTPIGSFKVRGGITYMEERRKENPNLAGVVCATRGNHGQAVAWSARRFDLRATILVPHGNSREKNAAMRALGADLREHGHDFQAAYEEAFRLSESEGLHLVKSFARDLVRGGSSYAFELFTEAPDLDELFVPIGLGSSICSAITARNALDRPTRITGVVAANAPAYALSFAAGAPRATESADTLADGLAVRVVDEDALDFIRHYFTDTHNIAEGAGAAALAAVLKEKSRLQGKRVGVLLSGGNIDRELYREILAEEN